MKCYLVLFSVFLWKLSAIDLCHAAMLSPRRIKSFFCTSKLVFKFFNARLDEQNVV